MFRNESMKFTLIVTILYSFFISAHSQSINQKAKSQNSIAMTTSPLYLIREGDLAIGMRFHYIRQIKPGSKYGIGLGLERIFDEHGHNAINALGSYQATENWIFLAAVGIGSEDENLTETNFTTHFETIYQLYLKAFRIGPAFEFSWDPEDIHFGLGLRLGAMF